MGKIIYEARNKAAEYGKYAFSAYHSCSNGCTYCYLRKGVFAKTMGGNVPTLKTCFKDEDHALQVFEKELMANLPELQKHGLFFTFTSDPCLLETQSLNAKAILISIQNKVTVKVLTKNASVALHSAKFGFGKYNQLYKDFVSFGFTLTGRDDLEPGASTNAERIEAMLKLHEAGFKTLASIEPVIDFVSSAEMMRRVYGFCDLYKVGLMSNKKYDKLECEKFIDYCCNEFENAKIYFKDSLLAAAGISRDALPENCVDNSYNMFNQ